MNWRGVFLWGFLATAVLTTTIRGSQAAGLTRMDIPFILGTIATPDRDRAKVIGSGIHFVNGWLFAVVYAAIFQALRRSSVWLGAALGAAHAVFVLVVVLPLLPGVHPRMASDFAGPEPTRMLEPPGFLVLHYGYQTPLVTVAAHIAYGAMLGAFYRPD
jgi:hypothetical protein